MTIPYRVHDSANVSIGTVQVPDSFPDISDMEHSQNMIHVAQSADCTIVNNDIMYESLEKYNLHHALPLGAAVSDSLKKKIWDDDYIEFTALLPEDPDKKKSKAMPVYLESIQNPGCPRDP